MAVVFPTPVKEIRNPNNAIEGMVQAIFTTEITEFVSFGFWAMNMPIPKPTMVAMMTAVKVIPICSSNKCQ